MASYRGHLMFSTSLGLAYGGAAFWYGGLAWEPAAFGAVLTSLSGLAPDLDSDSGVPVRTLFSVAGLLVPVLLFRRLLAMGLPLPQIAIALGATYLFIRYGLCGFFKRLTVHRGMFHSIPGMFITGLIVFLLYHDVNVLVRVLPGERGDDRLPLAPGPRRVVQRQPGRRQGAAEQVGRQRVEAVVVVDGGNGDELRDPGRPALSGGAAV